MRLLNLLLSMQTGVPNVMMLATGFNHAMWCPQRLQRELRKLQPKREDVQEIAGVSDLALTSGNRGKTTALHLGDDSFEFEHPPPMSSE